MGIAYRLRGKLPPRLMSLFSNYQIFGSNTANKQAWFWLGGWGCSGHILKRNGGVDKRRLNMARLHRENGPKGLTLVG